MAPNGPAAENKQKLEMETAFQAIGSYAAAAFAWVVLEFIGRPLRRFIDLRGEIIRK
jgi:hypothetical protein